MTENITIAIENLSFTWPNKTQALLSIPNWKIKQGERIFLYGRSGSGKSTLLNLIAGILQPQQGRIEIDGENILQLSQRHRDRFRAKNLGFIFQQFNLIPYLSVADNIRVSQVFSGCEYNHKRVLELTDAIGLTTSILQQQANQISVGQQQRVAVIRALYHQPDLIIADEPTSALDTETRDEFIQLLLAQGKKNNSSVLFVSHDKTLTKYFDKTVDLEELNQAGGK